MPSSEFAFAFANTIAAIWSGLNDVVFTTEKPGSLGILITKEAESPRNILTSVDK